MQSKITQKIINILKSKNLDESKLIDVLSKIRKIIELNNSKEKYKIVYLYSCWALHTKINDTKALEELGLFLGDDNFEREVKFMSHGYFFTEVEEFFKEYSINIVLDVYEKTVMADLLNEIFSNTPLIVGHSEVTIEYTNGKTYWKQIYK